MPKVEDSMGNFHVGKWQGQFNQANNSQISLSEPPCSRIITIDNTLSLQSFELAPDWKTLYPMSSSNTREIEHGDIDCSQVYCQKAAWEKTVMFTLWICQSFCTLLLGINGYHYIRTAAQTICLLQDGYV